jgi:hypothetical protein
MRHRDSSATRMKTKASLAALACGLLLLALPTLAQAAPLEAAGYFGGSPTPLSKEQIEKDEEIQLGGTGGMAVNYTGAGGVPKGTVYAARWEAVGTPVWVAMYEPQVDPVTSKRELEFASSWQVTVVEGSYGRCGPALIPPTTCPPKAEGEPGKTDVVVDQSTGNVFAYNATRTAGRNAIVEYTPDGSKVLARFGEIAPSGKTTAETPTLVHDTYTSGGLAVNGAGEVYIYDTQGSGSTEYHRLMKFRPKTPGKYDEYEYAGTSEDVGAGFRPEGRRPEKPVADAAGNLYVAPEQKFVEKYDLSKSLKTPACSYEYAKGGITQITVDPLGETPFFFTYKEPKRLYRLGPCNPATGKFENAKGEAITEELVVSPERDDLYGLAYDPASKFTPDRPAGILYGAAPNPVSSNGVGKGEPGQSSLGYVFAEPAVVEPPAEHFAGAGCFAGHYPGLTESCKPVPKATLEEPGFKFSEEVQLGGVGGMAVNYTGAGGVPAGTVYAATYRTASGTAWVAMYVPKVNPLTSERELVFATAWEVSQEAGSVERCGPLVGTKCAPLVGNGPGFVDVDIDQETGNVYALNNEILTAGRKEIVEFDASGSKEITRFGVKAEGGKTTAETPAQIHSSRRGGIAVNGTGEVYVYDSQGSSSTEYHRLMKFRPTTPGKYDEYEYAGTAEDVGAGFGGEGRRPWSPVADAAGNLYAAPDEKFVEKYDLAKSLKTPACSYEFAKGGITQITVDPKTGTPFFFTYKEPKRLYRLGPCNPATGKFENAKGEAITEELTVSPERDDLYGLAYDPASKFTPDRPAGILYGAAPNPVSSSGVGKGEPGQSSLGYVFAPAAGPTKTLTVAKTGSGTVTSSPAGIDCGATCSAEFLEGSKVALSAKAAAGSTFVGWSGACSGAGLCEVTMSEAGEVSAAFEAEPVPGVALAVSLEGSGSGTVTSDSGLISCAPFCEDEYAEGTEVTLTASPAEGSQFMAWRHCDTGGIEGRQCTVTMSQAKEVSAYFSTTHSLTLAKAEGSGPGKVQSSPAGVICLYGCKSTTASFLEGKSVTLKATPAKHFHLASWEGDCEGKGACELSMGEDHEVSALFEEDPKLSLSLAKAGGGQALIKTKPAGISCGNTCLGADASFYEGEAITVSWKLNKGTSELTWTQGAGTCTGSSEASEGSCTLSLASATALLATLE